MDEVKQRAAAAAKLMKELGEDEREELIVAAGAKVLDLRPRLHGKLYQSQLAQSYRAPGER